MKAVIMAAGMGTRFGDATKEIPKGFIPFKGIPMVVRSIETLRDSGITDIIIGTGYHSEAYDELTSRYPGVVTCLSPLYATTNSMYTLYNVRSLVDDDFILLESDLVFEKRAITSLLEDERPDLMLATPVRKFQDQYYVQPDATGRLINCSTDPAVVTSGIEMVGIHKISREFYRLACEDYERRLPADMKLGYEYELLDTSRRERPLHVLCEPGLQWYEIDDSADLEFAEHHIRL